MMVERREKNTLKFRKIFVCFLLISGFPFQALTAEEIQEDRGQSEPVSFLLSAQNAMKNYHHKYGAYPDQWTFLDVVYVHGKLEKAEPGSPALTDVTNRWKPDGSPYTYEIRLALVEDFLVAALDEDQTPVAVLASSTGSPLLNLAQNSLFDETLLPLLPRIRDEIQNAEENPQDFFAETGQSENTVVFHLWHKDAFLEENLNVIGNPSGKCRDIYYDLQEEEVSKVLWWQ